VILNVARENCIVFWDEHKNSNTSKTLERRKHGYEKKLIEAKKGQNGGDQ